MKVLMVHNYYQQPGGEDAVFRDEAAMLRAAGHDVSTYTRHNDEILEYGLLDKLSLSARTIWAWDSAKQIRRLVRAERPDIAHFHNTFPLISPAAYLVCQDEGVPVVQTLHNPRLMCPAATLHREGHLCEDCVGRTPWPGVLHHCYRGSIGQTSIVAAMLALHRALATWQKQVDAYICSTHFYRRKFVSAGLPSRRIAVKPHFVPSDPGIASGKQEYALFVGRLEPEKGIRTLLEAWRKLPNIPLKIRGEGSLLEEVQQYASNPALRIELLSRIPAESMPDLIKGARFLVWPSEGYYETFGRIAIESFACGVPVIASQIGAMAEVVADRTTGLHFAPGDSRDLASKVEWAWMHPQETWELGRQARSEYELKYTAARNYELLRRIYGHAKQSSSARPPVSRLENVA
jgi:glycosyltransferase involved in cell wall biosynthesis